MKQISFAELTKQVHLINDMILSDMICESGESSEDANSFSKHLLTTKYWFARISWANKKRYILALLQDVQSAWTLSLLLKSMWNCRTKDSVMSVSEQTAWSSYDQVPMDHNRTALPLPTLAQVMKNDRVWFLSLEPESQALVLSELLTVAGGPVMWEVLRRARVIYDRYRDQMLQNLEECIVVSDSSPREKSNNYGQPTPDKAAAAGKKDANKKPPQVPEQTTTVTQGTPLDAAQKDLENNLAAWNATIKALRDSLKLEELEMTFKDGTKRKIWKVNRPKPEVIETVDFVQLLPSSIGKRIMSYLPRAQLADYARVNKYWAYLVDEFRAELAARAKINAEFERLNDILIRHDNSLDMVDRMDIPMGLPSSQGMSVALSIHMRQPAASMKASEKSAGVFSMRNFLTDKNKPLAIQRPIRNMEDLTERLEKRGAADENLWKWCENVLRQGKRMKKGGKIQKKSEEGGVLTLGNVHFPCPLMKLNIDVPLDPPLYKDPAMTASVKPKKNVSDATLVHVSKEQSSKRYSLWTRDLSGLYPVFKIPSYYQY